MMMIFSNLIERGCLDVRLPSSLLFLRVKLLVLKGLRIRAFWGFSSLQSLDPCGVVLGTDGQVLGQVPNIDILLQRPLSLVYPSALYYL
jgi:hypothetical protein